MKIILSLILLFFACGLAMVLLTRLMHSAQRIGQLKNEMGRSNDLLQNQMKDLKQQQAALDARQALADESKNSPQVIEGEIEEPTIKPKEH